MMRRLFISDPRPRTFHFSGLPFWMGLRFEEGITERGHHLVVVEGFNNKVGRALLEPVHSKLNVGVGREEHNLCLRPLTANGLAEPEDSLFPLLMPLWKFISSSTTSGLSLPQTRPIESGLGVETRSK